VLLRCFRSIPGTRPNVPRCSRSFVLEHAKRTQNARSTVGRCIGLVKSRASEEPWRWEA
jgi:hypothetical protein